MKIGDNVKLIKFNGKTKPEKTSDNSEAYWKLIGEMGIIQQDPEEKSIYAHFSERPRVLVKFNTDLASSYGLINHNNINNSLWILVSDLEVINQY